MFVGYRALEESDTKPPALFFKCASYLDGEVQSTMILLRACVVLQNVTSLGQTAERGKAYFVRYVHAVQVP